MNRFRRLTYYSPLVRVAHGLGLSRILSVAYRRMTRAPSKVTVSVFNNPCTFQILTHWQQRVIESLEVRGPVPDLEALAAAIGPGDTVYDVGANMGIYTVALAHLVGSAGRVISFEPQPEVYNHLQQNLRLNNLANVRAFRKALGDHAGKERLYCCGDTVLASLTVGADGGRNYQMVEVTTGDELRLAENLPYPRAVKIDVEGNEYAAIQGMRATLSYPICKLVCCELHPPLLPKGIDTHAVIGLLESLGFTVAAHHDYGYWSIAIFRKQ